MLIQSYNTTYPSHFTRLLKYLYILHLSVQSLFIRRKTKTAQTTTELLFASHNIFKFYCLIRNKYRHIMPQTMTVTADFACPSLVSKLLASKMMAYKYLWPAIIPAIMIRFRHKN